MWGLEQSSGVLNSVKKPGGATVLFMGARGSPRCWGKPGGKKGLLFAFPVRRDLPKGGVGPEPAAAVSWRNLRA